MTETADQLSQLPPPNVDGGSALATSVVTGLKDFRHDLLRLQRARRRAEGVRHRSPAAVRHGPADRAVGDIAARRRLDRRPRCWQAECASSRRAQAIFGSRRRGTRRAPRPPVRAWGRRRRIDQSLTGDAAAVRDPIGRIRAPAGRRLITRPVRDGRLGPATRDRRRRGVRELEEWWRWPDRRPRTWSAGRSGCQGALVMDHRGHQAGAGRAGGVADGDGAAAGFQGLPDRVVAAAISASRPGARRRTPR